MVSYTAGAILVGIILFIIGSMTKKSKKRKNTFNFAWVLLGIGIFGLAFASTVPFLGTEIPLTSGLNFLTAGLLTPGQTTPAPSEGGQQTCFGIEDTTITLSSKDSATAVATGGTHGYRINDAPLQTVANAGTFTASPGDRVQVLWLNASDNTDYYADVTDITVACAGTQTVSADLVSNGTMTIEVYNEEGDIINVHSANETLTNGDVVTLSARIKAQFNNGFPHGGVMIVEYDQAHYDDVIVDFGGSKVSAPVSYTRFWSNNNTIAYTIPPVIGTDILEGTVTIDVDDTNDPSSYTNNIELTFFPSNYYIDEDNGGAFAGPSPEDEDDVQTYPGFWANFSVAVD